MPIPTSGTVIDLSGSTFPQENFAAMTALPNGWFAAAWIGIGNNDISVAIFTATGVLANQVITLPASTTRNFGNIDIATLPGGGFVVAYENGGEISAQMFGSDGRLVGNRLSAGPVSLNPHEKPTISVEANGNFSVGFVENFGNIYATRFAPDGSEINSFITPVESNGLVNFPVTTSFDDGNVVWLHRLNTLTGPVVQSQITSGDLTFRIGSGVTVSDQNSVPALDDNTPMQATKLADGNIIVTWLDTQGDLNGRIITPDGTFAGGVKLLAANASNSLGLTALHDGGFVVGYTANAGTDALIRHFSSNGTAMDAAQLIDTGASNAGNVSLVTLADGRIVASFYRNDGAADNSYAQIFDPRLTGLEASASSFSDDWVGTKFNDNVFLGRGNDMMNAGLGNDTLRGEAGNDKLTGGGGKDKLFGGNDRDLVNGNSGNDIIDGGLGNDTLNGGTGNDTLQGRSGADRMTGGGNADRFFYLARIDAGDTVTDFGSTDVFVFEGSAFGLGSFSGILQSGRFASKASGHSATDSNDRFIFDRVADELWFDANGTTSGGAIKIADLNNFSLTNADILIV